MFPIVLDPQKLDILVVGTGPATARRCVLLDAAGFTYRYIPSTFGEDDVKNFYIVFIADFDEATSAELYARAKAAGAIVNVEDKRHLCDFHVPAIVRRGDLLLTVSTNAASPRLARRLRMMLETLFPPEWSERLALIGKKRRKWKAAGVSFDDVSTRTDSLLDEHGWLDVNCPCLQNSYRHPEAQPKDPDPMREILRVAHDDGVL